MAKVSGCNGKACAFNDRNRCHATAINVGGPDGPFCDTFVRSSIKCGCSSNTRGQVGACKITACQYNECRECVADQILVSLNSGTPKCSTFKAR